MVSPVPTVTEATTAPGQKIRISRSQLPDSAGARGGYVPVAIMRLL